MIAAVVCYDLNNAIGYQGQLLFKSKQDMAHFKNITIGNTIIAGRKTYESFQVKPLPNRINIVITHGKMDKTADFQTTLKNPILCTMSGVKSLLLNHKYHSPLMINDVFVIGGASIYEQLLPYCQVVYATEVMKKYENADAYFPKLNSNEWEKQDESILLCENDIWFKYVTYVRKQPIPLTYNSCYSSQRFSYQNNTFGYA